MPFLAAAAPYIALASTVVSAYGQQQAGVAQENQAKIAALQDEREANAAQAISQRQAQQERKKARYLRSRALAVAGASGAGTEGGVSKILADIEDEGEMNALNTLYSGDETARALRSGAVARRAEGKAAKGAAYGRSAGTLFSGFSSASQDYGDVYARDYGRAQTFFGKYGGKRAASTGFGPTMGPI